MTKNRLSKVLASAGIASRRACEKLIFDGKVSVNKKVVLVPQTMVDPQIDKITINGKPISNKAEKLYYILNKPKGYICSNQRRDPTTKLVLDLFKKSKQRLFTVGRLDKDTTGLLIITNDGHFANEIIHPSSNIEKEYLAKTDQDITAEQLKSIAKGTYILGSFVKPKSVKKVRKGTIKIVVMEGKKHEIRILLKKAGLKTKELSRIRLGNLRLGNLPIGQYKNMTKRERELLASGDIDR